MEGSEYSESYSTKYNRTKSVRPSRRQTGPALTDAKKLLSILLLLHVGFVPWHWRRARCRFFWGGFCSWAGPVFIAKSHP